MQWSNVYFEKNNNFFYRYALMYNSFLVLKNRLKDYYDAKKRDLKYTNLSDNLICCFNVKKTDFRKPQRCDNKDNYFIDLNGNTYAKIDDTYIMSGDNKPHKKVITIKKYILDQIIGYNTKIGIYENHIKYITDEKVIIEYKTEDAVEDNPFHKKEILFTIDTEDFLKVVNELHKDSFIVFKKNQTKGLKERKITIKTTKSFFSRKDVDEKKQYVFEAQTFKKDEVVFVLELSLLLNFIRTKYIRESDMITFYKKDKFIIINERLIIKEEKKFLCF